MNNEDRVILIYKRTHTGDPNSEGVFGCHDCMGTIRNRKFTDVIGIGGICPDSGYENMAEKINWIGIGATKLELVDNRAMEVVFDHFCLLEEDGELVEKIAPNLYKHMYLEEKSKSRRSVHSTSLPVAALKEAFEILEMAKNYSPSKNLVI